jgi:hypothetical protein
MEDLMQIFLSPEANDHVEVRKVYDRALSEARELYIATAYSMDWNAAYKLSASCRRLVFLVGTDFGLTRKAALLDVLRWIPRHVPLSFFGAVPRQNGNFHPKIVAWKAHSGKCYCMIGSSNLSKAAFSDNYEANVLTPISSAEFARLSKWLDEISEDASPVSKDWINHHYTEAKIANRGGGRKKNIEVKPSNLPSGPACRSAVLRRRRKEATFVEIGDRIRRAALRCSNGKIGAHEFWETFWDLWANHTSRVQGRGIEFKGKGAKWDQACGALIRILNAGKSLSTFQLDQLVVKEIDGLRKLKNPVRGSWLSEMLCHYFPHLYPVKAAPIQKWLSHIKLRARRGATEGQMYVDLAQKLRLAVKDHHPAGARNLVELDGAIWRWARDHGLLKR